MSENPIQDQTPETQKPRETEERGVSEYERQLREENKAWRLKLRDAESQLETLKAQASAEFQERLAQVERQNAELAAALQRQTRMTVAVEFGLPSVLAERLQGQTEEEIRADAQKILSALPTPPPPAPAPKGGLTTVPDGAPNNMSALERVQAKQSKNPFDPRG